MTIKEAIKCLKVIESEYKREHSDADISDVVSIDIDSTDIKALNMVMGALEEYDDCIVLTEDYYDYLVRNQNKEFTHVADLDDARPGDVIGVFTDKTHEERTDGEWIIVEKNAEWFEGIKGTVIKCRDCHFIHTIPHNAEMYNFCPKCGRRMKVENVYTKTTDSPSDAEERRQTDDNKK